VNTSHKAERAIGRVKLCVSLGGSLTGTQPKSYFHNVQLTTGDHESWLTWITLLINKVHKLGDSLVLLEISESHDNIILLEESRSITLTVFSRHHVHTHTLM
jgi:hypothetical protein